jgi:hypothetical protein
MRYLSRILLVLLIILITVSGSSAQDLKVTEKVLPNGLKVLLKEEHKAPVVTFQIWYKVGSRNEKLGTTGISHKKVRAKDLLADGPAERRERQCLHLP